MTLPFLDYTFRDPELLRLACTVPLPNREENYQRLEFLGDAVLQILISERLYATLPTRHEGDLTQLRSHLVSGKALLKKAKTINLASLLEHYNPGETWPEKALIDTVEALFGALWLDGGKPAAEALLATLYTPEEIADTRTLLTGGMSLDNPKGALATVAQRHNHPLPVYKLLSADGPSHAPTFHCAVSYNGLTTNGTGTTRKQAEARAAEAMLRKLKD